MGANCKPRAPQFSHVRPTSTASSTAGVVASSVAGGACLMLWNLFASKLCICYTFALRFWGVCRC
jgi:hypothetical protein